MYENDILIDYINDDINEMDVELKRSFLLNPNKVRQGVIHLQRVKSLL